jgi:hypothetical protein
MWFGGRPSPHRPRKTSKLWVIGQAHGNNLPGGYCCEEAKPCAQKCSGTHQPLCRTAQNNQHGSTYPERAITGETYDLTHGASL